MLFLIWLVLPPLYVIVLGRHYVRQCAESATAAAWARQQIKAALDEPPPLDRHHLEEPHDNDDRLA